MLMNPPTRRQEKFVKFFTYSPGLMFLIIFELHPPAVSFAADPMSRQVSWGFFFACSGTTNPSGFFVAFEVQCSKFQVQSNTHRRTLIAKCNLRMMERCCGNLPKISRMKPLRFQDVNISGLNGRRAAYLSGAFFRSGIIETRSR